MAVFNLAQKSFRDAALRHEDSTHLMKDAQCPGLPKGLAAAEHVDAVIEFAEGDARSTGTLKASEDRRRQDMFRDCDRSEVHCKRTYKQCLCTCALVRTHAVMRFVMVTWVRLRKYVQNNVRPT